MHGVWLKYFNLEFCISIQTLRYPHMFPRRSTMSSDFEEKNFPGRSRAPDFWGAFQTSSLSSTSSSILRLYPLSPISPSFIHPTSPPPSSPKLLPCPDLNIYIIVIIILDWSSIFCSALPLPPPYHLIFKLFFLPFSIPHLYVCIELSPAASVTPLAPLFSLSPLSPAFPTPSCNWRNTL